MTFPTSCEGAGPCRPRLSAMSWTSHYCLLTGRFEFPRGQFARLLAVRPGGGLETVVAGGSGGPGPAHPPRRCLRGRAVPAGLSADGLPLGLQVIGRAFDEELVLRVGEVIEHVGNPAVRRWLAGEPEATAAEGLPWDVRKTGSAAIECAFAAAGLLRVARFEAPNVWDVAGGIALVRATGGTVLERDGASPTGRAPLHHRPTHRPPPRARRRPARLRSPPLTGLSMRGEIKLVGRWLPFTAEQICAIVALACEPPTKSGRPLQWIPARICGAPRLCRRLAL